MTCPYCQHTFPLTWARYFKSPTGKHTCPSCNKQSRLKFFRAPTFLILLVVCLVCSVPGAILVDHWIGPRWRGLGVLPSLIVIVPLARWFETRKQLTPIEELAPSTTASCAECGHMFNVADMIAHGGLYVCAQCKPVFLQKLAEGADAGSRTKQRGPGLWVVLFCVVAILAALYLTILAMR
jgi:hypothetical protein